jgi:hypothetical protein
MNVFLLIGSKKLEAPIAKEAAAPQRRRKKIYNVTLASVIVCLRSIQETPAIIDVENRVSAEHASDSGDSTPPIAKTLMWRPLAWA